MNLDTRDLKLFLAIAESGNFGESAAKCFLSPSAATNRIKRLEEQLDVQLFRRSTRSVHLTAAGKCFQKEALKLAENFENLKQKMNSFRGVSSEFIRIGVNYCALNGHLPEDLGAFLKQNPSVRIGTDMQHSQKVVQKVIAGEADIGICNYFGGNYPELAMFPYAKDAFVLLADRDSVTFRNFPDEIDVKDIGSIPLVLLHANNLAQEYFVLNSSGRGIDLNITAKFPTTAAGAKALKVMDCGMITLRSSVPETDGTLRVISLRDSWTHLDIRVFAPAEKTGENSASDALFEFLKARSPR